MNNETASQRAAEQILDKVKQRLGTETEVNFGGNGESFETEISVCRITTDEIVALIEAEYADERNQLREGLELIRDGLSLDSEPISFAQQISVGSVVKHLLEHVLATPGDTSEGKS